MLQHKLPSTCQDRSSQLLAASAMAQQLEPIVMPQHTDILVPQMPEAVLES